MDFGLSEEQTLIRSTVREFLVGECPREVARELDEAGTFPEELLHKLAELGFCGLTVPEAWGGAGPDLLGAALVMEQIAAVSPVLALAFAAVTLRGGQVVSSLGDEAQKQGLLPRIASGDALFTFVLPSGDDHGEVLATGQGESFFLEGSGSSVSLAGRASHLLTLAAGFRPGEIGESVFLVPSTAAGLRCEPIDAVGMRGAGLWQVVLEKVEMGAGQVLGGARQVGQGGGQLARLRAVDQLGLAAVGLGLAQGAYDYAVAYSGQRVQFGRPIAEFEAVHHKFVDLAGSLRGVRLLLYETCWRADRGISFEPEAALAALQATALARHAALEAVHILGGQGYMLESDAQRYLRDALTLCSMVGRSSDLKSRLGVALGVVEDRQGELFERAGE